MIIKSKHTSKLSVNEQHEYITLRTPNGNFTTSYSGYKATGGIDQVTFNKLVKFLETGTGSVGKKMEKLLNPTTLSKYFPNWDSAPKKPSYKKGDTITINESWMKNLLMKHYGTNVGIVEKINPKNLVVRMAGSRECVSVPLSDLK